MCISLHRTASERDLLQSPSVSIVSLTHVVNSKDEGGCTADILRSHPERSYIDTAEHPVVQHRTARTEVGTVTASCLYT